MPSDILIMLAEDDATHDALTRIFASKRCPPCARDAYIRNLKAAERRNGEISGRSERLAFLRGKRQGWQLNVADINRKAGEDGPILQDQETLDVLRQKIAQTIAEEKAIRDEKLTPSLPVEKLAEFLKDSPAKTFKAVPVKVALENGQTPMAALDACRAAREDLVRKKNEIGKAPLPFADALARLKDDVYKNGLPPDFSGVAKMKPAPPPSYVTARGNFRLPDSQGHIKWPTQKDYIGEGRDVETELGVRMLCWLFRDEIVKRGKAELETLYAGNKGLSAEERTRVIAELDAEILETERREEMFVRLCEDAGMIVHRRPLANPLAVLGIEPA